MFLNSKTLRPTMAVLLLAAAACGGGSTSPTPAPPPPPPPTPVATVVVDPPTANLLAPQTQALTATTKDASGNILAGRTVTWSTSAEAVASVSSTGLVTAAGAGTATVTATSEGKTGTAVITVGDGGQVQIVGGTVTAAGGTVQIVIPAGAIGTPLAVTVTPLANPPALPDPIFPVKGASFTFGPEGTTFSAPVTVTMKYDPAKLPAWALPTDLVLYHHNGTAWEMLPNLVVDSVAHTVTAKTTGFSPFTVGTRLPPAVITPDPGSVNFYQRSVRFTATIPGHTGTGLTYTWNTTGLNGAVSGLGSNVAQYTMTQPSLPSGDLDQIQVIIRGPIDPTQPTVIVPLASAEVTVNAALQATFEVNPDLPTVGFGGTKAFDAVIKDPSGAIYTPPAGLGTLMVWTSTTFTGDLDIANPNQTNVTHGTYTAKTIAQGPPKLPPRIDEISVDFYVGYWKEYNTIIPGALGLKGQTRWDSTKARYDVKSGSANAFIEVAPKVYLSQFKIRTIPTPGGACITVDAVVDKVTGATSYDLVVKGIVGSSLGVTIHKVVTGITHLGNILDVYDAGPYFGVPMDGGCNTIPSAIQARRDIYQSQYGNATFEVTKSP